MRSQFNIETVPLALRNSYFLQSARPTGPEFSEQFSQALSTLRPALVSLFRLGDKQLEADTAVRSRVFPQMVYNPDHSSESLAPLTLSGNHNQEELWSEATLEYTESEQTQKSVSYRMTAADLVALLAPEHFTELGEKGSNAVPLADYLALSPRERERKRPFVYSPRSEGEPAKLLPNLEVLVWTVERMELWKMLQELSGVSNPFVKTAIRDLQEKLDQEKSEALQTQRSELEAQIGQREQSAVRSAMSNLAQRLTGLSSGELPKMVTTPAVADGAGLQAAAATDSSGVANGTAETPSTEDSSQGESELPWIESEECTSCDDCININSRIFAYNQDKKVVIKDARGGPFRDIVKAAEKCPAMIIHPGKPLDPNEKDLPKWINRAEKFQ
jgi:pyruvate-ferredoxin/flavodoxin oxidoreductase